MGLDMYLYARMHVSGGDHGSLPAKKFEKFRKVLQSTLSSTPFPDYNGMVPHVEVKIPLVYWRKDYRIHNWLSENLENGVDNCQDVNVYETDLDDLIKFCKTIFGGQKSHDDLVKVLKWYNNEHSQKNYWDLIYYASW